MTRIIDFFRDVRIELAKVTWPTRAEVIRSTLIVIGLAIVVAVFLGLLDLLFQWLLQNVLLNV